ncbi:hypothetical protein, partial [Streptomyces sp. NPDC001226]
DQIRVVGRRERRRGRVGGFHLRSALLIVRAGNLKNSHHRRSQGTSPFRPLIADGDNAVDPG